MIDRVIRALYGDQAKLHITVWGGNFTLVLTEFGRFKNYMFVVLEPKADGFSKSVVFIFSPGAKRGALYRACKTPLMRFQAVTSRRFFRLEAESLFGVEIRRGTLVESDHRLKDYLDWLFRMYSSHPGPALPAGACHGNRTSTTAQSKSPAPRERPASATPAP
jgi:hypothetical protein